METEYKMTFSSADEMYEFANSKIFEQYCLDVNSAKTEVLENLYLDTPNGDVTSRHASVRVRKHTNVNGEIHYTFTVKISAKIENGLHQRYEWNVESEDDSFKKKDFLFSATGSDDPDELLSQVLDGIEDSDLRETCSTCFKRTTYTFGFGDSIMEVCFDDGILKAGSKEDSICEMEIELISGDVVDLNELAEYIVNNTSAVFFNKSKYSRCLSLLNDINE